MVKVLFMDVDGTLTDGKIYMGNDSELLKAFHVRDGYGIRHLLSEDNIIPVIITNRESQITLNRCKELGIEHVYQKCGDKTEKIKEVAAEFALRTTERGIIEGTAYIGDDIPDLSAMKMCEYIGCPKDAVGEVKAVADYVCSCTGGNGAVREFIEWLVGKVV